MNRWIVPALAMLGLSLSASAGEPAATYAVARFADAVVTADFNGDGLPDLAASGYDAVSVLLGNGDGTFQPALNSPSWGTGAFAVGDFDQDGNPDLATSDAILLGNGDGTFAYPSSLFSDGYHSGYYVVLAVGDLNRDGKADLVGIGDYGCGEWDCWGLVTVQIGNGDGTFASPTSYSDAMSEAGPVGLGDFDGDGNLDVVTPAGLQLGNGDGTLRSPDGWRPGSGGVADFNGDGKLDVVGRGESSELYGYVLIQLGNGDGTFQSGILTTVGAGFGHMTLADYDGDGKPDLALTAYDGVEVLLGNGDGTLRLAGRFPYDAGYGMGGGLAAADFDGDGFPDLAATVERMNTASGGQDFGVSIFLNEGSWPPPGAPSLAISDATVTEGDSGTRAITFTMSLSAAYSQAVTVEYGTADGAAKASSDYEATSGTLTIDAGQTSGTITVLVNGDRLEEPDETFVVNLDHATNAFLDDHQGVATILDDEPRVISITPSVSQAEGQRRQTTPFTFIVSLSSAYNQPISVSFRTLAGSGTANVSDYVAVSGSLTFRPGQTAKPVTVDVKGDSRRESDETFTLELYAPSSNASLSYAFGIGTILNDD